MLTRACSFFLGLALAATACAQAPGPLSGRLTVTGASSMAPLLEDLARRFRALHPAVEVRVEGGGSGRGIADALAGRADIGMVSRELKPGELALFAIPVARDGVAFLVHRDNPVRGVTRAQAAAVFTGRIAGWKALGGADTPIVVGKRSAGHKGSELVPALLGIEPADIKAHAELGNHDEVVAFVAARPGAIAFLSVARAHHAARSGKPLRPLALDGIEPAIGSVRAGTWPLSRPLNLVTRSVPSGLARAFIEFTRSPAARPVILEHDYVPYLS